MTWDEAAAFALAQPGTELTTSYRQPAVKANGHAVINVGNEPATSFCLHLAMGTIDMLIETHPATFFHTPHYAGWAAVLVRYDSPDDALVREQIARACEQARSRPAPRPRRRRVHDEFNARLPRRRP